jgi:hypothetical protein
MVKLCQCVNINFPADRRGEASSFGEDVGTLC